MNTCQHAHKLGLGYFSKYCISVPKTFFLNYGKRNKSTGARNVCVEVWDLFFCVIGYLVLDQLQYAGLFIVGLDKWLQTYHVFWCEYLGERKGF